MPPYLFVNVLYAAHVAFSIQTRNTAPSVYPRRLQRRLPASSQICRVSFMDVSLGVSERLPPPKHLHSFLRWHVQVDHQVRLR